MTKRKAKKRPPEPPANILSIEVTDYLAPYEPTDAESVAMRKDQVRKVFGYDSIGGLNYHADRISLRQIARGAWVFRLSDMLPGDKVRYDREILDNGYTGKRGVQHPRKRH